MSVVLFITLTLTFVQKAIYKRKPFFFLDACPLLFRKLDWQSDMNSENDLSYKSSIKFLFVIFGRDENLIEFLNNE